MKIIKKTAAALLILLMLLSAAAAYYYFAFQDLTVSAYVCEASVTEAIRIVQLTDLHNKQFGENNEKLVSLVAEQRPDLIVLSGDMLNGNEPGTEIVTKLIGDLAAIAPVYYGYGNHEKTWERNFSADLRQIFTQAGAVVVDNDYIDTEINGQKLRIGGYMGYYRQPGMFFESKEQYDFELRFADDFEDTDLLKVLINHIPTQWVDWDYINKYPVDFVFSGHYHGGMIRIPIWDRGLAAPYVGWFPPYTKGVFAGKEATCILSAGLGIEHHVPRLNNPPEIVLLDLIPRV